MLNLGPKKNVKSRPHDACRKLYRSDTRVCVLRFWLCSSAVRCDYSPHKLEQINTATVCPVMSINS